MKILKKILKNLLIFILLSIPLIFIATYHTKSKYYSEFSNMRINVATYYEWGTGGRGASQARYFFISNGKKYKSATTFATFEDANPRVNKNYIVVYNAKNPKRSTMFLNLPVHDSMRQYFRGGSIDKIPIEYYQRTIDSFYLRRLTTGFNSYFPPYYKKEDFPELEYLWKE